MHERRLLHAIRLQAAWEPPARAGAPWIRRFGRPAGVDPGQRVWLVVAGAQIQAAVALNGAPLPAIAADRPRWEHDITPLLRDRNVLELLIPQGAAALFDAGAVPRQPAPAACGNVAIEIVADRDMRDASAPHRA